VDGYADGKFNPTNTLTRQAAAKIICNLILGPTTAAELHADTAPYKDVPATSEFAGYIAYCAKEGIISGYADGTFKPGNSLTGYAFMKMLLGALGYDQEIEGYVGGNWSINVAKQAINVGLNKGLEGEFNGIKAVNREEACLYAFNTLKADMVEYDTTISTTINGQTVTIGNSQAKAMQWKNSATRKTNIKNDQYVQFAEQYFPNLVLTLDQDDFGRPANTWTYKKNEIGTYVNWSMLVAEYTAELEGGDLYDVIGATALKEYDLYAYIDGRDGDSNVNDCVENVEKNTYKKSEKTILNTDNGVLTQVFVDLDNEAIYVVSINTYLAFATADYNTSKETLSIEVHSYDFNDKELDKTTSTITKLDGDDYDVEDYEEGDAMLVTIADGKVKDIMAPETMTDCTVTQFTTGNKDNTKSSTTKVTVDGTSYSYNLTATYDDEVLYKYDGKLLTDKTYNFFLDQYGYVIGAEEATSDDQYVFISAIDYQKSNLLNATADAAAIFTDGTQEVITVKVKATNDKIDKVNAANKTDFKKIYDQTIDPDVAAAWNTWYSYTVKDGVYTLTPVVSQGRQLNAAEAAKINSANSILKDGGVGSTNYTAYGNSKSIYITVDTDTVNGIVAVDDVTSVTTGIKAVDLSVPATNWKNVATCGVYFIFDSKDYVIAAIVVGDDNAQTKDFIYLLSNKASWEKKVDDDYFWEFDAIVEGEDSSVVELDVEGWSKLGDKATLPARQLVQISKNSDGYVVKAEDASKLNDVVNDLKLIDRGETKAVELLDVDNGKNPAGPAVLYQKDDTLYVNETRSGNGLVMADDVKIVVIDNGDVDDSIANLKSALAAVDADLDKDECQFDGDIVAILNNKGEAETLILDGTTPKDNNNQGSDSNNSWKVTVDTMDNTVSATCKLAKKDVYPTAKEVKTNLTKALNAEGFVVSNWGDENVTFGSGNRTITVVDPDLGVSQTFTVKVDWVQPK
ncbi:MAG: S-layer homology domain-containing protein, partial [Dysosmobacter sp.]|nr:S-layer homology domain-containing protein [Dysosmobacter sp.]